MERLRQYAAPALTLALTVSTACTDVIRETREGLITKLGAKQEGTQPNGDEVACIVLDDSVRTSDDQVDFLLGKKLAGGRAAKQLDKGVLKGDKTRRLELNTHADHLVTSKGMVICAIARNPFPLRTAEDHVSIK